LYCYCVHTASDRTVQCCIVIVCILRLTELYNVVLLLCYWH